MTNRQIADALELLADLLEFDGANTFRVRGVRNAARAIRHHSQSVAELAKKNPAQLQEIDGVGKGVAEKCVQLVVTGELEEVRELLERIPQAVLDLLRIPNLGPKKAAALHSELGIQSLDQLKTACEEHRVRELKGFGAKTEQAILEGLDHARDARQRICWADADEVASAIREHLKACEAIEQLEFAGSYRRGKETVGDLDLLVVSSDADKVMDRLAAFDRVQETLVRGGTKMSVRLNTGLQVDLRVVPARSFGAALQYFTGSKEHNVILRGLARQDGLKVNEWGVFRVREEGDDEYLAGADEQSVYAALGLPLFPPELREGRDEFDWAEQEDLPALINFDQIRGDLHMHTTATDGKATLEEMISAARERGLEYIAITDHSQRVSMAGGLDADRLRAQWEEIDQWNERLGDDFRVLKGIECDILEQGGMDLADDVLAEADWVLASIHYGQNQSRRQLTDRLVGAVENPHVCAIAHPTGRLLNRRPAYDVDLETVFAAARENRKLMELNANPRRLDLHDIHCARARELGVPIVINTDAHSVAALGQMRYGVLQARRGGLTRADVANTRTWKQLQRLLPRG